MSQFLNVFTISARRQFYFPFLNIVFYRLSIIKSLSTSSSFKCQTSFFSCNISASRFHTSFYHSLFFQSFDLIISPQLCFSKLSCPILTSKSVIFSFNFLISFSFQMTSALLKSNFLITFSILLKIKKKNLLGQFVVIIFMRIYLYIS